MTAVDFALFDTPLGACAIAWSGSGIAGVQLPQASAAATRARMRSRFPGAAETAPPAEVAKTLDGIRALLRGGGRHPAARLDFTGVPPFHQIVYDETRALEPGQTISYGALAVRVGAPGAARAVGQAMARNPFPILVPCHRVLAANGRIGGFSANGGVATKIRLLALENDAAGIQVAGAPRATGRDRLGFDPDRAVAHLRSCDEGMARLIERAGPLALVPKTPPSLFLALAEAIAHQQLTGKAAQTIFARFCAIYPNPLHGPTPRRFLRTPEEVLRSAGLSRSKLLSLRDLARRTVAGEMPTLAALSELDDAEIVDRLTAVRGIGKWTVEMLLIFRLGRPDVLPVDDYGIRKGFRAAFRKRKLPTAGEIEKRGERWRPYRTAASWYLWRAADSAAD